MKKFVVVKIDTEKQSQSNWHEIKQQEYQIKSNNDYNVAFNDISNLYIYELKQYEDGTVKGIKDSEQILSIESFLELCETKYEQYNYTYVGWNILDYDIPFIIYHCVKNSLDYNIKNLFNLRRFSPHPIFDIQQWLYNWKQLNSLLLTAADLNITIPEVLFDNIQCSKEELLKEKGRLITKIFKRVNGFYI